MRGVTPVDATYLQILEVWLNCRMSREAAVRPGQRATNGGGGVAAGGPGKICQFKLVLLGESAVGKSSLVLRFVKGQFHEYQESTIGGEFYIGSSLYCKITIFHGCWLGDYFLCFLCLCLSTK